MTKLITVMLATMMVSASAMASDGQAEFRTDAGHSIGFTYDMDMHAHHVTGWYNSHQGNMAVDLHGDRGSWSGQLGMVGITGPVAAPQADGSQTLEVRTIYGIYDYTLRINHHGDLEINTVSPKGNILTAELRDNGRAFSVGLENASFEVSEDAQRPGHYEGPFVYNNMPNMNDNANLRAEGELDLRSVAQKDKTLFVLLYVLPFHLEH